MILAAGSEHIEKRPLGIGASESSCYFCWTFPVFLFCVNDVSVF